MVIDANCARKYDAILCEIASQAHSDHSWDMSCCEGALAEAMSRKVDGFRHAARLHPDELV